MSDLSLLWAARRTSGLTRCIQSHAYLELMRFVGRFRFYSPFNAMLSYPRLALAGF
jgi:hypothetical protein